MTVGIISRAEAKARGLKRWFSGEPCKQGHTAERSTAHGVCIECRLANFKAWEKANPARRKAYIEANREKKNAKNKARRAAKPEAVRARLKAYREANADKLKAYREANADKACARAKAWTKANPDKARSYGKTYREANREKIRARKKAYHEANRDKINAKTKEWLTQNPDAAREHRAAKRGRKRNQMGVVSRGIRAKLRGLQNGKCVYCHVCLKVAGEHLDHVVPLALGGLHDDANLQLLCPPCNMHKKDKHPDDFARELGLLL
jgi:5-methylcytosine-specific restriction endonuclease McrA